jgi:hypothetical protein
VNGGAIKNGNPFDDKLKDWRAFPGIKALKGAPVVEFAV